MNKSYGKIFPSRSPHKSILPILHSPPPTSAQLSWGMALPTYSYGENRNFSYYECANSYLDYLAKAGKKKKKIQKNVHIKMSRNHTKNY